MTRWLQSPSKSSGAVGLYHLLNVTALAMPMCAGVAAPPPSAFARRRRKKKDRVKTVTSEHVKSSENDKSEHPSDAQATITATQETTTAPKMATKEAKMATEEAKTATEEAMTETATKKTAVEGGASSAEKSEAVCVPVPSIEELNKRDKERIREAHSKGERKVYLECVAERLVESHYDEKQLATVRRMETEETRHVTEPLLKLMSSDFDVYDVNSGLADHVCRLKVAMEQLRHYATMRAQVNHTLRDLYKSAEGVRTKDEEAVESLLEKVMSEGGKVGEIIEEYKSRGGDWGRVGVLLKARYIELLELEASERIDAHMERVLQGLVLVHNDTVGKVAQFLDPKNNLGLRLHKRLEYFRQQTINSLWNVLNATVNRQPS